MGINHTDKSVCRSQPETLISPQPLQKTGCWTRLAVHATEQPSQRRRSLHSSDCTTNACMRASWEVIYFGPVAQQVKGSKGRARRDCGSARGRRNKSHSLPARPPGPRGAGTTGQGLAGRVRGNVQVMVEDGGAAQQEGRIGGLRQDSGIIEK